MGELPPVAFLRSTPPFDALPPERFLEAASALEVAYWPAGTELVKAGNAPLTALHVIRQGAVRILRGRRTVEVLERGEAFGYTSLLTGEASFDVLVDEDLLAYLVPERAFRALLQDGAFAAHFASGLSQRLSRTLNRNAPPAFQLDLSREVGALVRRAPVWVREDASVGEAARAMRDAKISSVLVSSDPPAIVTDRDFRNRVLAERRGAALPVSAIATRPLRTVDVAAPIHAAWAALLDAGVHHLPLVRDGAIVGLVTSTDLLRATVAGPVGLLRGIERLTSRAELPGHAERVAEMADAMLAGGLDAVAVGGFVARLGDALVARLATWAEEDLGPPPGPWAYVVLGAEGRMEQPLVTERDHGVVAPAGADLAWYQGFAAALDRDLWAAGFPAVRGRAAAAVATLDGWKDTVARAAGRPGAEAPLLDLRVAAGGLDVAPLLDALAMLAGSATFRRGLLADALSYAPPAKLGDLTVNLDAAGLEPVVRLARAEALAAGARARGTLERLDVAVSAGRLSPQRRGAVVDAFRFVSSLRLRLVLRRLAEGRPPSSAVEPASLDAGDRAHLKDAFRAIRAWQERVAARKERG
ncbi:MAG: putative nucleotidyltransferase substrate binding domain-containing protein [Anaeromyxobacteraceae bacterium]